MAAMKCSYGAFIEVGEAAALLTFSGVSAVLHDAAAVSLHAAAAAVNVVAVLHAAAVVPCLLLLLLLCCCCSAPAVMSAAACGCLVLLIAVESLYLLARGDCYCCDRCHTFICSDMTYSRRTGRWTRALAGCCNHGGTQRKQVVAAEID